MHDIHAFYTRSKTSICNAFPAPPIQVTQHHTYITLTSVIDYFLAYGHVPDYISKNEETGIYELERYNVGGDYLDYEPIVDDYKPKIIKEHGTRVTLFGKNLRDNTMERPDKVDGSKDFWLLSYINKRFHDLPDGIEINSDIPSESEIEDARKRFKNGKCQGTDKIYGEEIKYNISNRFMVYLMLLISTVWTSLMLPSSWLVSSITCLFKNKGSRSDAGNYRGLSIM